MKKILSLLFISFMMINVSFLTSCSSQGSITKEDSTVYIPDTSKIQIVNKSWVEIKKKVILITGSASGFGKASAKKLIAKGHIVYGADINAKGNQYLVKIGGTPLQMDVRKNAQVLAGVARIIKEQGRIDVLVNNAGYGEYGLIETMKIKDLINQFNVNVFGYARLQQAVLPYMRKQRSGRIILVSSGLGKFSMQVLGWYAATKHAVEGMADALRIEVHKFNIDVVKIQPGASNTNFVKTAYARLDQSYIPEDYKKMVAAFRKSLDGLMAKAGGPDETANAIVEAVETAKPKISYVTMPDAKFFIQKRKKESEEEFYKMFMK